MPIIGPVQLKDTNARVNAMKKMPTKPPLFEASSALFVQLEGNVISKYPKKETAKTRKRIPKPIFTHGSVESLFKASEPKMVVMSKPIETYKTMILNA